MMKGEKKEGVEATKGDKTHHRKPKWLRYDLFLLLNCIQSERGQLLGASACSGFTA